MCYKEKRNKIKTNELKRIELNIKTKSHPGDFAGVAFSLPGTMD